MKNKRVMITGGAGFIGSNLADELSLDNEVVILDDLSTGNMENINELLKKENVTFIHGNITDLDILQKNFNDIDYVFHQAALANVPESIKNPISNNNININGTLNVLTASRDNQIKKVVYASSSAIYGDSLIMPITEITQPNPKSPYAVAKLAGEYYCDVFSDVYKLPTTSLRYFNVYGQRQNQYTEYAAVIPKFINRVITGRQPIIYGDGLQTRDFIFVKDVVKANILAAESRMRGVFNIGSGISTTIYEVANLITILLGKNLKPLYDVPREGDIRNSFSDINKFLDFGFRPEYSLGRGLRYTIKYILNRRNGIEKYSDSKTNYG